MDRDLSRLAAVAALALFASATAFARDAAPIHAGEKSFGELGAGGQVTITLDAAAGTSFEFAYATWKGDDLVPDITVTAPDGAAIDIAQYLTSKQGGRSARLRGLLLPASGSYRITIAAHGGTHGGFDLATKGRRPTKFGGKADAGAGRLAFGAVAGDAATLTMKAKRADMNVVQIVDPAGAATAIGARPPARRTLAATGDFGFDVTSTAAFSWSVKLKPAALRRTFLDSDALEGRGAIAGTIRLDGVDAAPAAAPAAAKSGRVARRAVAAGELIVAYLPGKAPRDPGEPVRAVVGGAACEVVRAMSADGPWLVRVPHLAARRDDARGAGRTRALARGASRAGGVKWAATNDVVDPDLTPNDTLFPDQTNLPQIRMPEAWDLLAAQRLDGSTVTIAVVDTGINTHADLAGVFLPGFDFVSDADGWDADTTETGPLRHGTWVSGVIGAVFGNSAGVAGAVPHARILPVRVLPGGAGTVFDIVAGMRWAAGLDVSGVAPTPTPARVLNCSFGGADHPLFQEVCAAVLAKGVVIVASAGNSATSVPAAPAMETGVVAVGALASNLSRASYSNYGSWVSIWAPGTTLTTSVTSAGQQTYEYVDGTSFAAPQVSSVAALVLAINPALGPGQVKDLLLAASVPLTAGMKIVDATAALQYAAESIPPNPIPGALPPRIEAGRTSAGATVFLRNLGTGRISLTKPPAVKTGDGGPWLAASFAGTVPADLPLAIEVAFEQSALADGVFTGTVTLETNHGIVVVPVRVVRSAAPKLGFVQIRALRPNGTLAATAGTSAAAGWKYRLNDVPDGEYSLVAEMDVDGTLVIDRADEWSGAWPLAAAPERFVLRHGENAGEIDLPMRRFDASFVRSGVGGGAVRGALAVRVLDAVTREPVPGARVYVGDAVYTGVTDARGRAVVVGAFAGGQVLTVVADGYAAFTRAGANAQFQSVVLHPVVQPETVVTVTVDGLTGADASVDVALGDAWTSVSHGGGGSATAEFTAPQRRVPTPVTVVARDAAGTPTRSGFAALDSTLGRDTASIVCTAASVAAPARAASIELHWPDAALASPSASTSADVVAIWSADGFPRVGGGAGAVAGTLSVSWAAPAGLDPGLIALLRVTTTDAAGRRCVGAFRGKLGTLAPAGELDLPLPPLPTSPADGASVGPGPLEFRFDVIPDSQFEWITLTDTVSGDVWEIETRALLGGVPGFTLPAIPERALVSGRVYRWTVRSAYAPGISADEYSDEGRAVGTTQAGESAPRTFTAK